MWGEAFFLLQGIRGRLLATLAFVCCFGLFYTWGPTDGYMEVVTPPPPPLAGLNGGACLPVVACSVRLALLALVTSGTLLFGCPLSSAGVGFAENSIFIFLIYNLNAV